MTDARATQVAAEQWSQPSPNANVTQVAVEQWGLTGAVGTQAVMTQMALEEWARVPVTGAPVDLAGNLGGVSQYGKSSYGVKLYSRVLAFEPVFSAALTVSVGRGLSGDLAPVVLFGGNLGVAAGVSGSLAPVVSFGGVLTVIGFVDFVGDVAPQTALGGSLAVDVSLTALEGGLTPIVVLGATSFISGPLWAVSEPCPSPPWMASEICPPSPWTISESCAPVIWQRSALCNG